MPAETLKSIISLFFVLCDGMIEAMSKIESNQCPINIQWDFFQRKKKMTENFISLRLDWRWSMKFRSSTSFCSHPRVVIVAKEKGDRDICQLQLRNFNTSCSWHFEENIWEGQLHQYFGRSCRHHSHLKSGPWKCCRKLKGEITRNSMQAFWGCQFCVTEELFVPSKCSPVKTKTSSF